MQKYCLLEFFKKMLKFFQLVISRHVLKKNFILLKANFFQF